MLSSFFLLLFSSPIFSGRRLDVYHSLLPHMMWPSANLECRSEMCGTRLAENKDAKITQKIAIWTPSHNFDGLYLRNWHSLIIEKNWLNSNISSTCPHITVNFGPPTAEIGWRVWGTPENFNVFHVLASVFTDVAQWRSTKLCTMFGRIMGWYTVYFLGLLPLNGVLPGAKFSVRPSLAFSCACWQRYCTAPEQPNFVVW